MSEATSSDVIAFQATNAIAVIRINRPDVHNALNESVIESLDGFLERVEADPQIRAVIITGSGTRTFCAGGDLQYFATLNTRDRGREMSRRVQAVLDRIWSGSRPVIAAVNGQAIGGGCEILTACHFRIAASTATFEYRQAANGLITGWGGGARLFQLVGSARALKLLLTAEPINTDEALRIGLIDEVVAPERLPTAAQALAEKMTRYSPAVVAAILELARLHQQGDVAKTIERETEMFADRWVSEEFQKAREEFQNNRLARKK